MGKRPRHWCFAGSLAQEERCIAPGNQASDGIFNSKQR